MNQRIGEILERIYRRKPDLLVFSCYIWNIDMVTELAEEFHKLCPQVPVWAGGPEVSYETEAFLRKNPAFTGVMMGEGERTFSALCAMYEASEAGTGGDPVLEQERLLAEIPGISWRRADGTVAVQPLQELLPMDELPFCYEKIEDFQTGSFTMSPAEAARFAAVTVCHRSIRRCGSAAGSWCSGNCSFSWTIRFHR